VNELGNAREWGSDDRQTAGHGLRHGQAEGVFEAGTDVEIRGGVEIENLFTGRFKVATFQDAELPCTFTVGFRILVAGNDDEEGQTAESPHGVKNGLESLDAPIVADEEKHKIIFLKIAAPASCAAPSQACRGRKLRGVNTVRNDANILPLEIMGEELRGAARDGHEGDLGVRVKTALETGQKRVIGAAMEAAKKTGHGRSGNFLAGKFLEPMEQGMNDDNVGVEAIDSGRKNEVEAKSVDGAIPGAAKRVEKKPGNKLQEVGTRDGRNFVPEDGAGILRTGGDKRTKCEIVDALRVEMNFAMLSARETFKELGESALSAMAAVHKR
jgi:hypothetical protein